MSAETIVGLRITWAERVPDPIEPKKFVVRYCVAREDDTLLGIFLTPDHTRLAETLKREIELKK